MRFLKDVTNEKMRVFGGYSVVSPVENNFFRWGKPRRVLQEKLLISEKRIFPAKVAGTGGKIHKFKNHMYCISSCFVLKMDFPARHVSFRECI